jgi:hypothetical protein
MRKNGCCKVAAVGTSRRNCVVHSRKCHDVVIMTKQRSDQLFHATNCGGLDEKVKIGSGYKLRRSFVNNSNTVYSMSYS